MLTPSPAQEVPTSEKPMLIGFMIDVSLSMTTAIRSSSGMTQKRLESFRSALDEFVKKGKNLCRSESSQQVLPLFKVFAYGFGFGNALSRLMGNQEPQVRDLLSGVTRRTSLITIDHLFEHWQDYQDHITGMAKQMFGQTPMLEAFRQVQQRFKEERAKARFTDPPILFVLSDGMPTDGSAAEVLRIVSDLRASGVCIISCYITDQEIIHAQRLYGTSRADWFEGAQLAFAYASPLSSSSSFEAYFRELGWSIDHNARLFAQVNRTELLHEFLDVVLSPLQLLNRAPVSVPSAQEESVRSLLAPRHEQVRVFVSYAHQDKKYLEKDSLLGYMQGLEKEGFEFWYDQDLLAGSIWNAELERQMASADIALVLVSQAFLNSKYCQEKEIAAFIEERKGRGLVIFPIILSACDWKRYPWLSDTQFIPGDSQNVESSFRTTGKRKEFFLRVLTSLRQVGQRLP